MIKRVIVVFLALQFIGCVELQKVANQIASQSKELSQTEIGNGLRQALNNGIQNQVSKLTAVDGFYKNELVKIVLPKELQVLDRKLRQIGLSSLADKGLKIINRAAEDAVKTATPIFVNAVKEITFTDAKNIL